MRDFVRSALFNILGDAVSGARFLDLFCGTGSVGLEALSRGAADCVFLDQSPAACGIVRQNLAHLAFLDRAKVVQGDFADGLEDLARVGRQFDLVFSGPPYGKGLSKSALRLLGERRLLAPGALVITEVFKKEVLSATYGALERVDERVYGDNLLVFYVVREGVGEGAGGG
jgi:16S rRNA (guanine(966)-N(2))-methyltransferase RsmD